MTTNTPNSLVGQLGPIDIYLLDQVMRGRIPPGNTIFDAGCGHGRNLVFFLRQGHRVAGVDSDPTAVAAVRRLAAELAPELPASSFEAGNIEDSTYPAGTADTVICSAVLHFASSSEHFRAMLEGGWRALRPGGLFFCRLASRIGMPESAFQPLGSGRYLLPDGSRRYLVDEAQLLALTAELGATLLDPIKTTVVQSLRCMTTWVVQKG